LLVEDDAGVRDTMAQLLRLDDHSVDCAANGRSALEQFAPGKYDVVISDLGMPDMTGWEVLAAIRAADATITTILASGWGAQIDPQEARTRGVDYIVPKPIDIDALNTALAAAQRVR
jgi:CheY-like chemotaxis protein